MLGVETTRSAEVMRQASMTANDYMLDAKVMIDLHSARTTHTNTPNSSQRSCVPPLRISTQPS